MLQEKTSQYIKKLKIPSRKYIQADGEKRYAVPFSVTMNFSQLDANLELLKYDYRQTDNNSVWYNHLFVHEEDPQSVIAVGPYYHDIGRSRILVRARIEDGYLEGELDFPARLNDEDVHMLNSFTRILDLTGSKLTLSRV